MHDSDDWREVQKKLTALSVNESEIKAELRRIAEKQDAQHKANKEKIVQVELAVLGSPDDPQGNPGLVRNMDTLLAYGKATHFWAKVVAALIGILLAYLGVRAAAEKANLVLPDPFHSSVAIPAYAQSKKTANIPFSVMSNATPQ